MVPTDKQKTIFKCLLKIDFSKDDLKQQLPDYSKFLNFQSCDDYIYKGEVYWREFRLLIFLHFNKFINSNIHYSKHIFQKPGLREQCIKLLEEGGEVNWKWFLPKMININRSSVLKKMFQLCKKQPVLTPEANIKVQKILNIIRRYTVEDPLHLLQTLYPDITQTVNHISLHNNIDHLDLQHVAIIYHTLNAHINWFSFNRRQILNTGLVLPEPCDCDVVKYGYDIRCSNCWKLLTARSTKKRGNPKNVETFYSTDTHTLLSSCCFNPVIKIPLSVGTTALVFNTQIKQIYHLCTCGCNAIIFHESQ